ncbi:MAG: hypothetical protein NT154_14280 [Verrucomicrobia bacterium]|nr:hypothetical protein [Verrucomicrobiota bacterium]
MKRNVMKRLKTCLWSLVVLVACSGYVFIWCRRDLHDARTLPIAVTAGVIALTSLAYSLAGPAFHHRVTKILLGCGALVATFCAFGFFYYCWAERVQLSDTGLLPILVVFGAMALGAAVLAWVAFWRLKWARRYETADPVQQPSASPNSDPVTRSGHFEISEGPPSLS